MYTKKDDFINLQKIVHTLATLKELTDMQEDIDNFRSYVDSNFYKRKEIEYKLDGIKIYVKDTFFTIKSSDKMKKEFWNEFDKSNTAIS